MTVASGGGFSMPELVQLLRWEVMVFLTALAAILGVKLLSGEINTRGLLYGRIRRSDKEMDRYFSPERVQLLIFTLGLALDYLLEVLSNSRPGSLPAVPDGWVAVLGGSNAVYLGGKAYTQLGRFANEGNKRQVK